MAFEAISQKSGTTFYLHARVVALRGGRRQRIYFFAKTLGEGAVDELPEGYVLTESPRTGLPLLKRA